MPQLASNLHPSLCLISWRGYDIIQWWAKQEPLCLEVNNPLSLPEQLVIGLAAKVERASLAVSSYMG